MTVVDERDRTLDPEELRLPRPTSTRWQPLRAGIQNLWEYDDQRFVFHRGRLMLRGRNESGKTKALELLFPFVFDADLSPNRLDPFGSNARKMAWNLLQDEGTESHRVGYVWLELGRLDGEEPAYLTLGAGLKAYRADARVDSWYFMTSRRVDADLALYDAQRVPISKGRLADALGDAGQVFERGSDYRRALNERLFGIPDEQYAALVETLLQLRRPQLAKLLEPAALSRILTASLPPLDASVIGTLAEGFERLDRHRRERDELRGTVASIREFLQRYRRYVAAIARAKATGLTSAESDYHRAAQAVREERAKLEEAEHERRTAQEERERLEGEQVGLDERVQTLKVSDRYRAVQQLAGAEREAQHAAASALRATEREAAAREQRDAQQRQVERDEARVAQQEEGWASALARSEPLAKDAALDGHGVVVRALHEGDVDTAWTTARALWEERAAAIAEIQRANDALREAAEKTERALWTRRTAEENEREREAAAELAERTVARERAAYDEGVDSWLDSLAVLAPDDEAQQRLLDAEPMERPALVEALRRTDDERLAAEENAAALDEERLTREETDLVKRREQLASEAALEPDAPSWRSSREGREGAPLYLLCEPRADDHGDEHAGALEGALEAAGLLDAWVTPTGELLDGETFDVVLRPAPLAGATLLDALSPTPTGGVSRELVERLLSSIRLLRAGDASEDDRTPFVATDGRFGVGPLRGTFRREQPIYLGATAREQERQRRLLALDEELARLRVRLEEARALREELRAKRRVLEEEVARFPSSHALERAKLHAEGAEHALTRAREELDEAKARHEDASARQEEARVARDGVAARHRLLAWVDALAELKLALERWREAVHELVTERKALLREQERLVLERERLARLTRQAEDAAEDVREASERAEQTRERARAFRDAAGADPDEILAEVRLAEQRLADVRKALEGARARVERASLTLGERRTKVEGAALELDAREGARRQALLELVALRGSEALALLDVPALSDAPTLTEGIAVARAINGATEGTDASPEGCERAENKVSQRWQDLQRSLPPELRASAEKDAGHWQYRAVHGGRTLGLMALREELGVELEERERRLDEDERRLFESFLAGEAHEHVRGRLRTAHELVRRMSGELEKRPTPSGTQLRLRWEVTEEAPAGAREAIELWLKSAALLTDAQRDALASFLRSRLDDARANDEDGSLRDRLVAALDYRPWFEFTIEVRSLGGAWKRLTRRVHGAGSGGQKAMLLHLPLFAAAAAFYDSADERAPRLFALDEAFAGIDRKARAELMGLVAAFDLDFVMTSFEEWGFYEELDGIATYNLSREPGTPGVLAEWFLWDGAQGIEVGFS